jgi:tetratricopeptide (TPR) repeat protein
LFEVKEENLNVTSSQNNAELKELHNMSTIREDPIKMHKDANALMESGNCVEARDLFFRVAELYFKGQNYFGAAEMNYKAGECSFKLKEYQKATELFTKSAEIALSKGFDRYGVSGLEQARDSQKALGNTKEVEEMEKKIKELNDKHSEPEGESSFSVFS